MNASQTLAWIICLALAFFASALAARNGYKTALLEKQLAASQQTVAQQKQILEEISGLLKSIDRHLAAGAGGEAAPDQPTAPAGSPAASEPALPAPSPSGG